MKSEYCKGSPDASRVCMVPEANGKSLTPDDFNIKFIIWLGSACHIRG